MRLQIALVVSIASLAAAERVARPMNVVQTKVRASDGRVAATETGFVVKEEGEKGDRLTSYGPDGGEGKEIFAFGGRVGAWWLAPGGKRVAWVVEEKLRWAAPGGAAEDLHEGAIYGVTWSADGARLAYVDLRTREVIVREGDKKTVIAKGRNRMIAVGPVFSGDGKAIYVVTRPVDDDALESPVGAADTLEWTDPADPDAGWHSLFHQDGGTLGALSASPKDARLVVVVSSARRSTLKLVNRADGSMDDMYVGDRLEETLWGPGGDVVVVTARGANGLLQAWTVETAPSGTRHGYAVDKLADVSNSDLMSPAVGPSGIYLLERPVKDQSWKGVVRAANR